MPKQPIPIKIRSIETDPDFIFTAKVIPSGHGAVIPFFKRFTGKEVYIILKEKCRTR